MRVYLNDPIAMSARMRLAAHVELVDTFDHPEELDAIVCRQQYVSAEVIERASRCKLIQQHGVGLDRIDVDAAKRCGIPVRNTPGVNARSVAEYAVAMMLALSHKVRVVDAMVRRGELTSFGMPETVGVELTGKRLGLVGSGHIAQEVADICAHGFHMHIACFDPFKLAAELVALGMEPVSTIEELFAASDIVSLHCLLTPQSHNLVDARVLECAKLGLILVNTARGGLVDEDALARALMEGTLGAAGLDTFEQEPPDPYHALFGCPNFLAGMHVAGSTVEALEANGHMVVDNVFAALGIEE